MLFMVKRLLQYVLIFTVPGKIFQPATVELNLLLEKFGSFEGAAVQSIINRQKRD
jgi:hypothetical protein